MTRRSIVASIAIALAGCNEASESPSGEPEKQAASPSPGAKAPPPVATPSSPTSPHSPSPSPSVAEPAAAAPPDAGPTAAPEPPAGPRWSLSCEAKGESLTLTADLRPGVGVLGLALADHVGRSRTWSKPEALVLISDLEEHVLGIHRPPSGGPDAEHLEFHSLPKTFVLDDQRATFSARCTTARLDDANAFRSLELSCKAHQEEGP